MSKSKMDELRGNRKLDRFFKESRDNTPRKQLRTGLQFMKQASLAEQHDFSIHFADRILKVAEGTVDQYEHLKLDDLRMEGEDHTTKLMHKWKRKKIVNADWHDIFDFIGMLIFFGAQGTEGSTLEAWKPEEQQRFMKLLKLFLNSKNDHEIRLQGLTMLMRYLTGLCKPHMELQDAIATEQACPATLHGALEYLREVLRFEAYESNSHAEAAVASELKPLEALGASAEAAERPRTASFCEHLLNYGRDRFQHPCLADSAHSNADPLLPAEQHARVWDWIYCFHAMPALLSRAAAQHDMLEWQGHGSPGFCLEQTQVDLFKWIRNEMSIRTSAPAAGGANGIRILTKMSCAVIDEVYHTLRLKRPLPPLALRTAVDVTAWLKSDVLTRSELPDVVGVVQWARWVSNVLTVDDPSFVKDEQRHMSAVEAALDVVDLVLDRPLSYRHYQELELVLLDIVNFYLRSKLAAIRKTTGRLSVQVVKAAFGRASTEGELERPLLILRPSAWLANETNFAMSFVTSWQAMLLALCRRLAESAVSQALGESHSCKKLSWQFEQKFLAGEKSLPERYQNMEQWLEEVRRVPNALQCFHRLLAIIEVSRAVNFHPNTHVLIIKSMASLVKMWFEWTSNPRAPTKAIVNWAVVHYRGAFPSFFALVAPWFYQSGAAVPGDEATAKALDVLSMACGTSLSEALPPQLLAKNTRYVLNALSSHDPAHQLAVLDHSKGILHAQIIPTKDLLIPLIQGIQVAHQETTESDLRQSRVIETACMLIGLWNEPYPISSGSDHVVGTVLGSILSGSFRVQLYKPEVQARCINGLTHLVCEYLESAEPSHEAVQTWTRAVVKLCLRPEALIVLTALSSLQTIAACPTVRHSVDTLEIIRELLGFAAGMDGWQWDEDDTGRIIMSFTTCLASWLALDPNSFLDGSTVEKIDLFQRYSEIVRKADTLPQRLRAPLMTSVQSFVNNVVCQQRGNLQHADATDSIYSRILSITEDSESWELDGILRLAGGRASHCWSHRRRSTHRLNQRMFFMFSTRGVNVHSSQLR